MPIYYALSVGGERKGGGKVRKPNEPGVKVVVNEMEVDDLRELVKRQRNRYLEHVDAEDLEVYYLNSRQLWTRFTGRETEGRTPVFSDETVDTSSEHAVDKGQDDRGTIYLGVTAPGSPGTFVCAVLYEFLLPEVGRVASFRWNSATASPSSIFVSSNSPIFPC